MPSRTKAEKAAESLRENAFLKESLSIVTLGKVNILWSEPMFSSLLSPKENTATVSKETFLEIEEVETLLKEHFVMQ